mgnify:CR=1 FL=1
MMKTVAFVPIKTNNERMPGKNTRAFSNGKPMLSYILNTLRTVGEIDEAYVYCSDESIREYLPEGIRFLKRDPYYDQQTTSFNEVLASFADLVDADIYLLTHATAPFISAETMRTAVRKVRDEGYDSAISALRKQDFVWKGGRPANYDPLHIPRTQDLEPFYLETCGLYVYRSELMKKEKRRIGDKPYLVEVSPVEACDVNDQDDFDFADIIACGLDTLSGKGGTE